MVKENFKYYAFISYNSSDLEWGKKLQRKLEHYRMPADACSERGWDRTPIRPVFFAPTDIQPGPLSDELKERLKSSKNLIVICSPNSAKSKWVGEEIAFFHSLGRERNILFFIVDGIPDSDNPEINCFHPIIAKLGIPEVLGANVQEKIYKAPWLNRERAYVQLISKLLGVEFDFVWERHRRLLVQKVSCFIAGVIAVISAMAAIWILGQPVDVSIKFEEAPFANSSLPPLNGAKVLMYLDNEVKEGSLSCLDSVLRFNNIPGKFHGKPVGLSVRCRDFEDLDTTVVLERNMSLKIYRDSSVYGNVAFVLWDSKLECPVAGEELMVGPYRSVTDKNGRFSISIPLENQKPVYKIQADIQLLDDMVHMPCGENYVILVR